MKMLIVEDNEQYLADALSIIAPLQCKSEIEVHCAGTLEEAEHELEWADIIVSDVFFPETKGGSPEPSMALPRHVDRDVRAMYAERYISGIRLAATALGRRIPIVLCTSTHHHAHKTEPANSWARENGMELVDACGRTQEEEAPKKLWKKAVVMAIHLFRGGEWGDFSRVSWDSEGNPNVVIPTEKPPLDTEKSWENRKKIKNKLREILSLFAE